MKRVLGEPLDGNTLQAYLSKHGWQVPADYEAFLLRWNGARPQGNTFRIAPDMGDGNVHIFLGVAEDNCSLDLAIGREMSAGRIPKHWLPIAIDGCGNPICLSLGGDDAGAIYFVDHERDDEFPGNAYKLAASFTEFIEDVMQPDGD